MGCPLCGKIMEYDVGQDEIDARESGALVQNAFYSLNADERESLITGLCDKHIPQLPDDDDW
jgi:hypothetical protein